MTILIETKDAAVGTGTTYSMTTGDQFYGSLDTLTSDWVAVTVDAAGTYSIGVVGLGADASGLTDPTLILHDAQGNTLALSRNDGPGRYAQLTVDAPSAGIWYVEVAAPGGVSSGDYGLVLTKGDRPSYGVEMGASILYRPGVTWADGPGSAATVTWGIRSEGLTLDASGNAAPFHQLTAAQIDAAKAALANYAEVGNITFQQQNPGGNSNDATILMGAYESKNDGAGAYAFYPDKTAAGSVSGDLWLNDRYVDREALPFGTYSFFVFLHELGHAMGLAHPGDYNAAPGVKITYAHSAQFVQDSNQYSVMSYFNADATEANSPDSYADTLMMYDIYAIQQMYGVNHNTRADDSTYGFHANVGGAYDFTVNTDPLLCIWDGGGIDTLDLSGFKKHQMIDLRGGYVSDVAGFTGNLSIAVGAVIENAVGGSKADAITGNDSDNRLRGAMGDDTLAGGTGNDLLIGNKGADSFAFADGMGSGTIKDFDTDADHLLLNADLWGGANLTAARVLSAYGSVIAGTFVLDFGLSEISFSGLTSGSGLEGQILIA